MAARWADGYQRRSKVKEFQFEIYKAMTTNYTDCVLQSIRLREAKAQEKIETEKRRLDELANAGVAMHLQIGSLFEENVSTPWFKVNGFFRAYAADPINTDFSLINQTMEHAADALAAASVQAWLPFKRTKLTTDLAVKHSGKEPTK